MDIEELKTRGITRGYLTESTETTTVMRESVVRLILGKCLYVSVNGFPRSYSK